jgi:putative Mn2+ efflux pump MntP
VVVDEDRGSFAPGYTSYIPETGGAWAVGWQATFEDIIFALHGALGAVSASPSGTFTYAAPLTSAWTPQAYTLELAYDIAAAAATGCLTQKVSIKGNSKKNWTIAQSGIFQQYLPYTALAIASSTNAAPIEVTANAHGMVTGQTVVITGHTTNTAANGTWTIIKTGANTFTLTGSTGNGVGGATGTATPSITGAAVPIADRTVENVLFAGETALWVDVAAATPGTTSVPSALVSFQLDIDNSLQGFFTGEQKYPTDFTQDKFKVELTVKLKWNAQTKALYDSQFITGNRTVWRIKSTSGAKSVQIDFAGVLTSDPANYNPEFGAIAQELKFSGVYDTGALANYLKVIAVNGVASLP